MRVYIAPCGIGLGHVTRAVPIARELEKRGIETIFSTYLDGLDFARNHGLPTYDAVPINFKVTSDGAIDFKRTAATSGFSLGIRRFLRQVTREMQFIKRFGPEVVFSDSRASSLIAARLLRIPVVLMLNQFRVEIVRRPSNRKLSLFDRLFFLIANIGWLFIRTAIQMVWGRSQVILIPDFPSPYTICLGNLSIPRRYNGKVRLIGPVFGVHQRVNGPSARLKQDLGLDPSKPLVYAAVSGPKLERSILSETLLDSLPALAKECQIVLSRGEPGGSKKPRSVGGITVYDWIDDQDEFILASDVVVGRSGHGTIMKSLAYGKPMVLIPIPDHTEQYSNASRAKLLGVAEIIDQGDLSSETLRSAIATVLGNHEYKTSSLRIMETAATTEAVAVTCNAISSLAQQA